MTRIHYQKMAKILRDIPVVVVSKTHYRIVNRIADILQSENSLFDRYKFLTACGIKPRIPRAPVLGTRHPASSLEARTSE